MTSRKRTASASAAQTSETEQAIYEEIAGLPASLRAPIVLCALEGLSLRHGRPAARRDQSRRSAAGFTAPGGASRRQPFHGVSPCFLFSTAARRFAGRVDLGGHPPRPPTDPDLWEPRGAIPWGDPAQNPVMLSSVFAAPHTQSRLLTVVPKPRG